MILGLGIDIVDIERIQKKVQKGDAFKNLVFSAREINDCEQKRNPYESFAARFAAKEAFVKALGTGITFEYDFNELEIVNDDKGKPSFLYSEKVKNMILERFATLPQVIVSLSHSNNQSVAVVILEKVVQSPF
jgi:holo-[acyl-carrier protein] synthase